MLNKTNVIKIFFPVIFSLVGLIYFRTSFLKEPFLSELLFFSTYLILIFIILTKSKTTEVKNSLRLYGYIFSVQFMVIYISNIITFLTYLIFKDEYIRTYESNTIFEFIATSLQCVFLGSFILTAWNFPLVFLVLLIYSFILFIFLYMNKKR